jgi:aminoglycoside phosphotransferase (APT) family kinase protein
MRPAIQPRYAALLPWIEAYLGGRVVACERQGDRRSGGRPAFFIDVQRAGGGLVRIYARLDRGLGRLEPFTLAREYAVLDELHRAGVAVPEPLGHCPKPEGILLERLNGDSDYSSLRDPAARDAIDRAFTRELAKIHAIDAERFERRGLFRPTTPEEFALADLAHWERAFDRTVKHPVPLLRFARNWLHENVPEAPERAVLLQGDTGPGQFMFEGPRLTGIIDWEFAHLGDPMLDLAYLRSRDWYNPGADLKKWLAYYAKASGTAIDLPRLRYYTVRAMIVTPLSLAGIIQHMSLSTDHAEWYAQDRSYRRALVEALAEALGVELPPVDLPEPAADARGIVFALIERYLSEELPDLLPDPFARYRAGLARRLATYARNIARLGAAFEAQQLDEVGELLGKRPAHAMEAELQLEEHLAKQPRSDGEQQRLLCYFHRQAIREERLLRGALGAGEHAVGQAIA